MKKITKSQVKAIIRRESKYNDRTDFYMLPSRVIFDNNYIEPYKVSVKCIKDFEKIVNEYSYYNCNSELGKYPAYYITDNYARYLKSEYK